MTNKSHVKRILDFINFYSIDVVTGSVMMGFLAVRVLNVSPPLWWYFILAMAVWVFYTADHLLDALKGKENSTIQRHLAHYIHRNRIIPLWIVVAITTGGLAFMFLDQEIIYAGIILGGLILTYFIFLFYNRKQYPWLLQKELIIGLVYVTGIWMAPLFWYRDQPSPVIFALIVNMVLLAWSEGALNSYFEYEDDLHNEHTSFTTMFGKKAAGLFVFILLILVIVTDICFLLSGVSELTIIISLIIQIIMSLVLFIIWLFRKYFRRQQLYRYIGEITFWLPGLILFA